MTGDKYKDVDVPFCVRCTRFMVIYIGRIWVALNHEGDKDLLVRHGAAYKCPQCASIIIRDMGSARKWTKEEYDGLPHWKTYLEDHTTYNKNKARKEMGYK